MSAKNTHHIWSCREHSFNRIFMRLAENLDRCYLPFNAQNPHIRPCREHSLLIFHQNFFKLADNLDRHKIWDMIEFRPDWTIVFEVSCPFVPFKPIFHLVRGIACLILTGSLWKLQITWTGIKSWDKFEFWQDQTIHFGVNCPWSPLPRA